MKKIATIKPLVCCAPGSPPLPPKQLNALAARFKALSDPTRLAIVNSLAGQEEGCVCEFQALGLSQPTISHHLRVLREAGLVEVARKRGTWTFYRLVPETVDLLAFALAGREAVSPQAA
jgi:ArsR family transcriptional regulator, arsenate/arsenite/antimonite-responsive transcriptional repressor